jgi:predicted GIY-YIG superfamily endonuclease
MDYWVYVLELEGSNWYVGMSRRIDARIAQHFQGEGSLWTKLHRPIAVSMIKELQNSSERQALRMEKSIYHIMVQRFGRQHVRGSYACRINDRRYWRQ